MRTVLICHESASLSRRGIARWLASFSDLVGIVSIREPRSRRWNRLRFERRRVGTLRLADVLAFRAYYRALVASGDREWERRKLEELESRFPPIPLGTPVHHTPTPNDAATAEFLGRVTPDLVVARCKVLLKREIYSVPPSGTFVFHPGICPEYRNAHGCFWALARGDRARVGMTLLRIDDGVDTGPVYGYFSYDFDEVAESHTVIQHRVVLDNLDEIRTRLLDVHSGRATPVDTAGRASAVWGHPWLTAHLAWKRDARRRAHAGRHAPVS